jgi:peptidoglycan hydrolase-like protein with peptidoglycan-binding domain
MKRNIFLGTAVFFLLTSGVSAYAHSEKHIVVTPKSDRNGGVTFSEVLRFGSRGQAVRDLQSVLSLDATIYPERIISGYSGRATESAVKRFQVKHNIVKSGDSRTTGFGMVGFKTNEQLRALSDPNGLRFQ